MGSVLTTKFHVPRPGTTLVPRFRLREKLDGGLSYKLTLVTAPAGFGKTTLLGAWITAQDVRVAWLSLDSDDNDPTRFLGHLIASIRRINTDLDETVDSTLHAPQPPPLESVLTSLINQLSDGITPFTIVMDDYHVVKTAVVHNAVIFLLEHLPSTVRLIIASRADPPLPLARLRARGELAEVRAIDLRFTPNEAAAFLNGTMNLDLSPEEVGALEARTEGWIAGLQLAALAMKGRSDTSNFISAFTGSHRYIVDYLIEDVLKLQPEGIQTFLLQTSILERLNGPLCDAVTAGHDGAEMLELLERSNLFLIPLDDERRWYRYHHLFAEVLQSRLKQVQPEGLSELHRRAAVQLERDGLIASAAEHALAAGDIEWATRLIEVLADTLWPRGELTSLLGWLKRLPQEALRLRPRLLLVKAWTHFLLRSYDSKKVETLLTEAETVLDNPCTSEDVVQPAVRSSEVTELKGILAAIHTAVASAQEDAPRTLAYAREALEHLPQDKVLWRTVLAVSSGIAYDAIGDASAADRTLLEAITLGRAVGNTYLAQVATMNLARVRAVRGKLRSAAELSKQVLESMGKQRGGRSPITGYPHIVLGKLLYEWNDLAGATRHLEIAVERAQMDEHFRAQLDGYLALARVMLAREDVGGAQYAIGRAEEVALATTLPWAAPLVAAHRTRFSLWLGSLSEATHWAEKAGLRADDGLIYSSETEYIAFARVLTAQGRLDEALLLLQRLVEAAEAGSRMASVLELLILQSLALHKGGDSRKALSVMERALLLAEPEGYVRLFTDEREQMSVLLLKASAKSISPEYTAKLLASFPPGKLSSIKAIPTTHPQAGLLNEREMAVLRLMSGRLSDKEIAKEMSLSVSTIKWYSNRIYEKLGAHRRTEAVARARELRLL